MYNGAAAVKYIKDKILNQTHSLKVILMDIDMPVMDGLEV
jgi:CheY-like chemotaxis protein